MNQAEREVIQFVVTIIDAMEELRAEEQPGTGEWITGYRTGLEAAQQTIVDCLADYTVAHDDGT